MEVAIANNTTTTNTSNNQHHSLSGVRSPFQREVREWQRIDPSTGALLTGRLEADRWINGPLHSYGKISDSQNIAQPNGTQVSQRKQLEVLQQRTASGAMQVIRAQTVQSTSSRWSSSATSSPITNATTTTTRRTPTINGHSNNISESKNSFSHNNSLFHNNHTHLNGNHYNNINNITSSRLQPMLQAFATVANSDDDETCNNSIIANDVDVVVDDNEDYDDNANNSRKSCSHQKHNNNNYSNDSSNNSSFSNFLLLDTAPSLKLSNLMKSSSSVSSNSNSSTVNIQNFTNSNNNKNNSNRHSGNESKLSLHAIVGSTNSSNRSSNTTALLSTSTAAFNTTTSATNTAWQRRQHQQQQQQEQHQPQQRNSQLFEQLPTFGKNNSASSSSGYTQSCVGGAVADVDDRAEAELNGRVTFNSTATDERGILQLTPTHQQRRDLESFRHYSDDYYNDDHGGGGGDGGVNHHNVKNVDVEENDADLRLSMRHQRRQQMPNSSSTLLNTSLQRGRSISTDDLSTEWDPHGDQTMIDEPSEWKRVSKLRRSFQSPATTRTTASESYNYNAPRRPVDLPASSVSVSKIRAELENGRRLTTAMRNNHVDMAALQSILNASSTSSVETKPIPTQRSTFLTAESLKEIRNKLKKLSDESLYKEDFLLHQMPPLEHIEIQETKTKPALNTLLRQLTPERNPEINTSAPSAFKLVAAQKQSSPPAVCHNVTSKQHTTNSLESRQKYRDTSSAEWHLRRKSYGFEKMLPPEENIMYRMDASTDSGLGRSGELNTWSPTETVPAARSTVVHFGEPPRIGGLLQRRYPQQLNSPEAGSSSDEQKRHSIAFDDSQYVRKTSQVRFNGVSDGNAETESAQLQHYDTDSPTNVASSTQFYQRSQQKRVEFCKTEVHFAAESGRVNIVETDGKPPPTNNFRRRRRTTSGPLQSLVKGASTSEAISTTANSNVAVPITRFGDDNRSRTIATTTVAYKAPLVESNADVFELSAVTISLPKIKDGYIAGSRNNYASTSGIDTTDYENDDIAAIRGILKNKPIKPKPYHLGENFESPDALWGVQLKPVSAHTSQQMRMEDPETGNKPDSPTFPAVNKSVAERVHNVEKLQDLNTLAQHNGYSTKINLNLGETSTDWKDQELPKSNIMSIALHSPQANVKKSQPQPTPVARPRTTTVQSTDSTAKEPLRIIKEARGARKLREHELSFFGVPVSNSKTANNTSTPQTTVKTKRTLPQRHRLREDSTRDLNEEEHNEAQPTKWKLTNDRPDLLHHTEHSTRVAPENHTKKKSFSPVKRIQYSDDEDDPDCEHFYENLSNDLEAVPLKTQTMQTSKAYNRQQDLERDEKILSEMTHTADQTMKALSDEAVLKDQRRRSLTRRNSKPLETIDEKSISEKIRDKCIAVKVTRSTQASEAKRHAARQSTQSPTAKTMTRTRTSSQSSVESSSRARSRSLSSEREDDHTNTGPSVRSTTKHTRHAKPTSRSSSRDSQRSSQTLGSSGDEHNRRDERLRTKTKRSSSALSPSAEKVRHKEYERKERDKMSNRSQQQHLRSLHVSTAHRDSSTKCKSSSTTRSSPRERVECIKDATHTPQHSSSRRHRSESEKRTSSSRSAAVGEKQDTRSGSRLVRSAHNSQDYDLSQRSSNRSERSGNEKEKLTRSRGHSSRSAAHSSESKQQNHCHQHTSSPSATKMRNTHNSEQRKSSSATSSFTTADNSQTHSKNAQTLNGISSQRQHHLHPTQHVHSLTAATIATKQRERSGKDRK